MRIEVVSLYSWLFVLDDVFMNFIMTSQDSVFSSGEELCAYSC